MSAQEFHERINVDGEGVSWIEPLPRDASGWCEGVNHIVWSLTGIERCVQYWASKGIYSSDQERLKWKAREGIIHASTIEFVHALGVHVA